MKKTYPIYIIERSLYGATNNFCDGIFDNFEKAKAAYSESVNTVVENYKASNSFYKKRRAGELKDSVLIIEAYINDDIPFEDIKNYISDTGRCEVIYKGLYDEDDVWDMVFKYGTYTDESLFSDGETPDGFSYVKTQRFGYAIINSCGEVFDLRDEI